MVCRPVGERRRQCGQQRDEDVPVAGVVAEARGAVVVVEVLGQVGPHASGLERTGVDGGVEGPGQCAGASG